MHLLWHYAALYATAILIIFETGQVALLATHHVQFVMDLLRIIVCYLNHPLVMFVAMDTFIFQKLVMVLHSVIALFVMQLALIATVIFIIIVLLVVKMQLSNQTKLVHAAKVEQELLLHVIESILQLLCPLMQVIMLKSYFQNL